MTNREKYDLNRSTYDKIMTVHLNRHNLCPIEIVGAPKPECLPAEDFIHEDCEKCIQNWLNEEVNQRIACTFSGAGAWGLCPHLE